MGGPLLTVDRGALARIARRERIGEPHLTWAPTAVWRPAADEAAEDERAWEAFRLAGGVDGRGRVDADAAAVLRLLCAPHQEFYGWLSRDGGTVGVLVGVSGRRAVVAVADGAEVAVSTARASAPAEALTARLPDLPPARTRPLALHVDDLRPPAGVLRRPPSPEVALARRIAALPTTGGGQLSAAVRDHAGRRAARRPLRYADTAHGRFLNHMPAPDRLVIAPADRAALAERLYELRRSL